MRKYLRYFRASVLLLAIGVVCLNFVAAFLLGCDKEEPKKRTIVIYDQTHELIDYASHFKCPSCSKSHEIRVFETIECKCGASLRVLGNKNSIRKVTWHMHLM